MVRVKLPRSRTAGRLARASADVWKVHTDALERQRNGEDIILLSVGDPDFATPAFITQHVVDSLDAHRTHYSPAAGEPALRQAIAAIESRETGKNYTADQFVIFPGATAALFCVVSCIANAGDEIVVADPMYLGYQGTFDATGVKPRTAALTPPAFDLDVAKVKAAITPKTRAILVNTPGNPCGNIVPPAVLVQLNEICRHAGIWLICDEVYSLIYFDEPHVSILKCVDDLSNAVVIDSLSKSHAMSGWRIGWAGAPPDLAADIARFSGAAFFGCPQFVQDAAAYALTHDEPQVLGMRDTYRQRRDRVVERIRAINGLNCVCPKAGMFVMMDVGAVAEDGDAFARRLLDEQGVSTIPGSGFGATTGDYVRISLTVEIPALDRAFDRIERATLTR